jgi:hypothetical protein
VAVEGGVVEGRGEGVVDGVDLLQLLPQAHQEVPRLHIAVHEVLVVQELQAGQYLVRNHEHRLQGEPPPAELQVVLQRIAKQLRNEEVEVAVLASP